MKAVMNFRIVAVVLAILCLGAAQVACGLTSSPDTGPDEQPEVQQIEVEEAEVEEPDDEESPEESGDSMQSEDSESLGEPGEEPVEPAFDSDTLPCPLKGSSLYLGFDHALTINHEEASITHFLHQGWLQLQVTDDNGTIASQGSPSLTYSMEGKMSDECSLSAEGTMTPSAHGSCEAGVVSLFIEENWMAMDGEI